MPQDRPWPWRLRLLRPNRPPRGNTCRLKPRRPPRLCVALRFSLRLDGLFCNPEQAFPAVHFPAIYPWVGCRGPPTECPDCRGDRRLPAPMRHRYRVWRRARPQSPPRQVCCSAITAVWRRSSGSPVSASIAPSPVSSAKRGDWLPITLCASLIVTEVFSKMDARRYR